MRLALAPRLALLPAPAAALRLAAERFGPPDGEQRALLEPGPLRPPRAPAGGVGQLRAAAGPTPRCAPWLDPDSRVPERRVVLTPFPG